MRLPLVHTVVLSSTRGALTWADLIRLRNNQEEWYAREIAQANPGTIIPYLQIGTEGRDTEEKYVVV